HQWQPQPLYHYIAVGYVHTYAAYLYQQVHGRIACAQHAVEHDGRYCHHERTQYYHPEAGGGEGYQRFAAAVYREEGMREQHYQPAWDCGVEHAQCGYLGNQHYDLPLLALPDYIAHHSITGRCPGPCTYAGDAEYGAEHLRGGEFATAQ